MRSKQEAVLSLFFNHPTRHWHFEEILKEAKIARSKADRWLKALCTQGIIRRVKDSGRMPYYIALHEGAPYRTRKKLFAQQQLYDSGMLTHLAGLPASTVILFGSFSRSDWYEKSDIDLFIYGDSENLRIADYELKLHRDIQVFACQQKDDVRNLGDDLLRNILKGQLLCGNLDVVQASLHA